jgi:hypothetical protein
MRKALETLAASEGCELDAESLPLTGPLSLDSSPPPATNMDSTPASAVHEQTLHLLSPETNQSLNSNINTNGDTPSKHESSSSAQPNTAEPAFAIHPDSSPQADSSAQTKPSPQSTPASPTLKRLFIAAAIIVVLALGAFFVRLGINVQTTNYGIRINGQTDIILPTKTEAQAALDDLTAYYIQLVNADAHTVSASYEEEVKIIKSNPANLSRQNDQPHETQVMNRQEALEALINGKPQTTDDSAVTQPYLHVILKWVAEVAEPIDYVTETQKDETLALNTTQIQQEGEKGLKSLSYAYVSRNDTVIENTLLNEKITKEPLNEIVLEGTKPLEINPAAHTEKIILSATPNKYYGLTGDYSFNYLVQTNFPAQRIEFLVDDVLYYLESTLPGHVTSSNIGSNNYVSGDNMTWQCNNDYFNSSGDRKISVTAIDSTGNRTAPKTFTLGLYSEKTIVSALPNKTQAVSGESFNYTVKVNFPASKLEFRFSGNSTLYTVYADGTSNLGTSNSISSDNMTWQIYNDVMIATGERLALVTAYDANGNSTAPKSFHLTINP